MKTTVEQIEILSISPARVDGRDALLLTVRTSNDWKTVNLTIEKSQAQKRLLGEFAKLCETGDPLWKDPLPANVPNENDLQLIAMSTEPVDRNI